MSLFGNMLLLLLLLLSLLAGLTVMMSVLSVGWSLLLVVVGYCLVAVLFDSPVGSPVDRPVVVMLVCCWLLFGRWW